MSSTCSKYCVVIVCGLPGVGKTTFTHKLSSLVANYHGLECIHLEYDQFEQQQKQKKPLEHDSTTTIKQNSFDSQVWKSAREHIEHFVEKLLSDSFQTDDPIFQYAYCSNQDLKVSQNLLIFLDDNMYYHSMRFSFFKLCQKYKCGFVQLYLKAPSELAIHNDQQRPIQLQVGFHVIEQMKNKLEEPDSTNNVWEKHTITIDASTMDLSDQTSLRKIMDELILMAQDPLPEVPVEDLEEKERSRLANYDSTVHQFDLRSRKLLASLIPKNSPKAGTVASRLNQKRKEFLQALRASPNEFKNHSLEDLERLFVEEANKDVAES